MILIIFAKKFHRKYSAGFLIDYEQYAWGVSRTQLKVYGREFLQK